MKHDNDDMPMTPEKAIKNKAHELLMRMQAVGVPTTKSVNAALVVAIELRSQFGKIFKGTEAERRQKNEQFDLLEKGIKGYLPAPKEDVLVYLNQAVENAAVEAKTIAEFKRMVLDIVNKPKYKYRLTE